jgi:hypothetical protein
MRCLTLLTLPLILSACSGGEGDRLRVKPEETLLQVSATGRAETAPNEARFSAGVESIGASAGEASRRNNETINKVLAALDALGVKKEDVQTRQVSLQRITYGANKGRFQASNMISVGMRDVAKAGEAIAATTDAGANVLSGPDLTVGDPETARNGAYAAAFKAARSRAEAYAGAAGLKVLRVLTIRDSGHGYNPGISYDAVMAEQVAPPPVQQTSAPMIRPGVNTSEVSVQVDFALGGK